MKNVLIGILILLIFITVAFAVHRSFVWWEDYQKNTLMYFATANDPYVENDYLWGLENINVEKVWDFSAGNSSIKVGVLDCGVYNHNDLIDNLSMGYDFIHNNQITSDDVRGHGTHVAGIIGAVGNNEIGITGVNFNF